MEMSFFGSNSARPEQKGTEGEGTVRSEATFLGDVNLLNNRPETPPRAPFTSEARSTSATVSASGGPTPPDKCANVIAAGAKWQGTMTVEDSVRIDGSFSGEVQAKGTVHVAEGAQVDAKVRAAFVVISGNFRGEIRADQKVDLLPRSRVNGEVITKTLSVQEGAILDGRVQMTSGGEGDVSRSSSRAARGTTDAESRERLATGAANSGATRNGNGDQA
jgi:cytoskeletal protein CcmA (bactofilin family)